MAPSAECSCGVKQLRLQARAISKQPSEAAGRRSGATQEGAPSGTYPHSTPPASAGRTSEALQRCTCFRGMGRAGGTGAAAPGGGDPPSEGAWSGKGALITRAFAIVLHYIELYIRGPTLLAAPDPAAPR